MTTVIQYEFDFGEVVFLKTDIEQNPAIVFSICMYKQGEVMYEIIRGTVTSKHYDFELSREKNVLISAI
jgi:hypothetical protein